VFIFLIDKGRHHAAHYRTNGYVTDTRLKASFGALGRIDIELHPSGKEGRYRVPAPCNGRTESYEKATYRGSLVFRGEEGFADVRTNRVGASPRMWVDLAVPSGRCSAASPSWSPATWPVA
jgi:hypothetical protein